MTVTLSNHLVPIGADDSIGPISLSVSGRKVLGIYGVSGVGKTTLLRSIIDHSLSKKRDDETVEVIGRAVYVPQLRILTDGRTLKNFMRQLFGKSIPAELLDTLGVSALKAQKLSELSGGEAQRVMIAVALFTKPEVLLLDEPFSALDYATKLRVSKLLTSLSGYREAGQTLVASHDIDALIVAADEIIVLQRDACDFQTRTLENPFPPAERESALLSGEIVEFRNKILTLVS